MEFKHSHIVHVRFADIDAFGHVNNAKFLTYIEEARVSYFDKVVNWKYDWMSTGIILAKADINFKLPIKFKDKITIKTRCKKIGNKSIELEQVILKVNSSEDITLAHASTILVAFDYRNQSSVIVPDNWRTALYNFENAE